MDGWVDMTNMGILVNVWIIDCMGGWIKRQITGCIYGWMNW